LVADPNMTHAEKAAIRTKCHKLSKFIRLADFLVIDTLAVISVDRTRDLLNYIDGTKSKNEFSDVSTGSKGAVAANQKKAMEMKKKRVGGPAAPESTTLFTIDLRMIKVDESNLHHTVASLAGEVTELGEDEMLGFAPRLDEFQVQVETIIDNTVNNCPPIMLCLRSPPLSDSFHHDTTSSEYRPAVRTFHTAPIQ
jgi:hypothetical protein